MDGKDRLELGRGVAQKLWGKSRFEKMERSMEEIYPAFRDLALETWAFYARPGPDLRTRCLCTIAALTALGHESVLRMHVLGALNNGVTQQEIQEIILQAGLYAGDPRIRGALLVAKKAFDDFKPATDRP